MHDSWTALHRSHTTGLYRTCCITRGSSASFAAVNPLSSPLLLLEEERDRFLPIARPRLRYILKFSTPYYGVFHLRLPSPQPSSSSSSSSLPPPQRRSHNKPVDFSPAIPYTLYILRAWDISVFDEGSTSDPHHTPRIDARRTRQHTEVRFVLVSRALPGPPTFLQWLWLLFLSILFAHSLLRSLSISLSLFLSRRTIHPYVRETHRVVLKWGLTAESAASDVKMCTQNGTWRISLFADDMATVFDIRQQFFVCLNKVKIKMKDLNIRECIYVWRKKYELFFVYIVLSSCVFIYYNIKQPD